MEGEKEGRRMAGNASFNSEKKLNMLHHTTQLSQKKKQDITEKSNDVSCKKQKEHARIGWINFEYSKARQTNFKALWRTFNYPKTIDDTLVNSLNTYSLTTFQRKTKRKF